MFINSDGNWECEICGAKALLWGYHYPDCPIIRLTPHASDRADAPAGEVDSESRAAADV